MMSVYVDPAQLASSEPLPNGIAPLRASSSLNFLWVVNRGGEGPGLCVHNIDPRNNGAWYPPFNFRDWPLATAPTTYGQLDRTMRQTRPPDAQRQTHLGAALRDVQREFSVVKLAVDEETPREEVWLKFSRSKEQWTAYHFTYFWVSQANRADTETTLTGKPLAWLPLSGPRSKAVQLSGELDGTPVVDNLLRLLRDEGFLSVARSRAI